MKFKAAVTLSVILHVSLFALALYLPNKTSNNGTIYYVDLINLPGGSGEPRGKIGRGGSRNNTQSNRSSNRVRNLTVKKENQSTLRYPDQKNKNKINKKKKNKKELVTVVKKSKPTVRKDDQKLATINRKQRGNLDGDGLKTGISSGTGEGDGFGDGYGNGVGSGTGYFPYAYYIQTLRNKISSSWYSSLVSPGLKGKYVVTVYFRITRNGNISDLRIEQESKVNSLDLSALRAIRDASPFPPLPNDFPGQYLGVHFEFEWER